jgi:hypothetical protein
MPHGPELVTGVPPTASDRVDECLDAILVRREDRLDSGAERGRRIQLRERHSVGLDGRQLAAQEVIQLVD